MNIQDSLPYLKTPEHFRDALAQFFEPHNPPTSANCLVDFLHNEGVYLVGGNSRSPDLTADQAIRKICKGFGAAPPSKSPADLIKRISYWRSVGLLKLASQQGLEANDDTWNRLFPFFRDIRDAVGVAPILTIGDVSGTIRSFFERIQEEGLSVYPSDPNVFIDPITRCLVADDRGTRRLIPIKITSEDETHPLGMGGNGVVYAGSLMKPRHPERTAVVVKLAREGSSGTVASLEREADALRLLKEYGEVPRFHEFFYTSSGLPCLVIERIQGLNFGLWISRKASDEDVGTICIKIVSALAAMHRSGFAHLDIKPENIIIKKGDGRAQPFMIDFGNCSRLYPIDDSSRPCWSDKRPIEGNVLYFPREIIEALLKNPDYLLSDVDREQKVAWDIWCVGMTLYVALSGGPHPYLHTLFNSDLTDLTKVSEAYRNNPYKPLRSINEGLPEFWDEILACCLNLDPQKRYASADALLDRLSHYLMNERYELDFSRAATLDEKVATLKKWDDALFLKGDFERQKNVFDHAVRLFGDIGGIDQACFYFLYGRSLHRLKRHADAHMHLGIAKALLVNNDSLEAPYIAISVAAEEAFFESDPAKALHILKQVESLMSAGVPGLVRGRFFMTRSAVLRRQGTEPFLEKALENALNARREFSAIDDEQRANEARSSVANCLIELGKYEDAILILKTACKVADQVFGNAGPTVDTLYINLGDALRLNGNYEEAISVLTKARDLFPSSSNMLKLLEYLADAYSKTGNNQESTKIRRQIERMRRMKRPS